MEYDVCEAQWQCLRTKHTFAARDHINGLWHISDYYTVQNNNELRW